MANRKGLADERNDKQELILDVSPHRLLVSMNNQRWKTIKTTFEETVARPAADRLPYLEQVCTNDPALKDEIVSLLEHHEKADRFLEPPDEQATGQPDPYIGKHFGPYCAQAVIDHGGMDTVYMALRDDGQFQKHVAIKLVRPGTWSRELAIRFNEERRTLARLGHPNIASLLDGGTTEDSIPYLVMEYVNGKPIDEFCDDAKLPIRERLELFRVVCSAVQYAHQNLIVHRDLKPANILVTSDGIPKLLDFGIAKLLSGSDHTEPGDMTRVGIRFVTPEYSSPEQLLGESITTASDVYSLGVLLYKLLTGHRPYQFSSRLPHEVTRTVCEQEPRRPSTAAHKADIETREGETTHTTTPEEVSALRACSPQKLHRSLSGDLDNITLKALHKDPLHRYATVEQLSEDIRRHLSGLPVTARQDTIAYRGRKFVKRHLVGVSATAVVIIALTGAVIGVLWQANKATREASKAEQINAFLQEMLSSADPAKRGKDVTVAQALDQAVVKVDKVFATHPEITAAVLHTIGETYVALGQYDKAATQLQRSLDIRHTLHGDEHEDISTTLHSLAYVAQVTGNIRRADSLYQQAIAMHRRVQSNPDKHLSAMLTDWGTLLRDRREIDSALAILKEAADLSRSHFGKESREYATALIALGPAFHDHRELAAAESVYRTALDILQRQFGEEHVDYGFTLNNLAFVLVERSDLDHAQAMFRQSLAIWRKTLGNDHPQVVLGLVNLAGLLQRMKNFDEAERLLLEALALSKTLAKPDPLRLSAIEHLLGRNMNVKGEAVRAEQHLREAIRLRKGLFPPNHHVVAVAESELGRSLIHLKRYDEAEVLLNNAYKSIQLAFGDTSSRTLETAGLLKELHDVTGRQVEAEALATDGGNKRIREQ